ncbi:kinase-like domain-containing protein [Rhizophagus clarus]|uniref:Kinase-like domain-containing protein n=1 Tax=Rhizophagus clarus TaxID=94130 RepID=A0A8H3QEH7_9GLOM|nr:kinase-like domain-containing protein [Rhizophagus clarus]
MDQFISKNDLRWIPYDKFENIGYLDKGGFNTIYRATYKGITIVLKCLSYLNNSDENLEEFLNEWKWKFGYLQCTIKIFGFTKNPNTLDYMLIMKYANKNNLRKCLTEITTISWNQILFMLYEIIADLNRIHENELIHYNFHDDICKGERPEIIENTPQCYVDLMKKCWDEDPFKRPSASEVLDIIKNWTNKPSSIDKKLKTDIMEFINAPTGRSNLTESHPQAYYTSRLLSFTSKEVNKILEEYHSSQNELKEIQMELDTLQQKNSQFEQDIQNLRFEKINILQVQFALADNLTKQLKESQLKFQNQINQLNQEKNDLQAQLVQKETNIQKYKNKLIQFQNNHKQIEDENLKLEEIAETYYQITQNELKEIKVELDLQQRNSKSQEQEIDQLQQFIKLRENQLQHSEEENDILYQKNANLINQLENLFQQNTLLDDELSHYQLVDTNQNYGMNLNRDISNLNDNLKKYITDLNQNVIINIEEIKKLLLLYNCPTKILNQKDDQLLIQAVLQRHIIETIISHTTKYFQTTGQHYHLESDIINRASLLSTLLANISKNHTGNDKLAHEALTRFREQIYLILNNCGFANMYGENNISYEHPFIADCKKKLNNVIGELRFVKNQEKIAVDNLAATIICEVIKIFWFRLKVHEPVVQYVWIPSNAEVNKTFMEKNNFDDIDDENLCVDLCYFPLVGKDLTSNNQKVYFPAKVFVRKINNTFNKVNKI